MKQRRDDAHDPPPLERCRKALGDLTLCVEMIDGSHPRALALAGMLEKSLAFVRTDESLDDEHGFQRPSGGYGKEGA